LEDDVGADRVGVGVDRLRRLVGGGVVVYADVAEVGTAEAGFHVGAGFGVERGSTGVDHVVDRGAFLFDEGSDTGVADRALEAQ
jgi:hypothetical protein